MDCMFVHGGGVWEIKDATEGVFVALYSGMPIYLRWGYLSLKW